MNNNICYKALSSRDPRFDGVFYVGVTSTGIYCRPICPARTPKQANCIFFKNREAAEKELFRPCLRCRPELAPGMAPLDDAHRIANLIISYTNHGLEEIAKHFDLSSRQIRRIVQKEFGVSPIELLQTRRLLLAKQLLTETNLPITDIAFASGFSSVRRFNDAFRTRYRMSPSHLRKEAKQETSQEFLTLQLAYRPPYDWPGILRFLAVRTLKGVESIQENSYSRTVQLGKYKGWVCIHHFPEKHALKVELSHSLIPVLQQLLARLRNLFDLNAIPDFL